MNSSAKHLPWGGLVALVVVTVVPAAVSGHYLNRWEAAPNASDAAEALRHFPQQIGEWEMKADGDALQPRVIEELGILNYIHRTYAHSRTHDEVTLLLMVGRPGPLVRHPPEICYASQDNIPVGDVGMLISAGADNESRFAALQFKKRLAIGGTFSVAYSHTADGVWDVPRWPRLIYGGEPVLYKAQVLHFETAADSSEESSQVLQAFVESFVPGFFKFKTSTEKAEAPRLGSTWPPMER